MSVAVLARASYIALHGFEIHGRSLSWFKKVHHARAANAESVYGLCALPPALALADLYKDPKAWHPDVDDLDIPSQETSAVLRAAKLLKVTLPEPLRTQIEQIERLSISKP
jgi:hypothetical protein